MFVDLGITGKYGVWNSSCKQIIRAPFLAAWRIIFSVLVKLLFKSSETLLWTKPMVIFLGFIIGEINFSCIKFTSNIVFWQSYCYNYQVMENIIEVKNLRKKFGDFTAVDNISFSVKTGEIFAFLGPNGAGKSTTIKMLTTLLKPSSGSIELNGSNPVNHPNEVRHSFGIVFQDPSLDDELTAWENMEFHGVLYGVEKGLRRKRIEELMNFVELWDRKDSLVKEFSGGMKRRLEIARGLLHHPKVIFLDEPTLGLDPQTRNHMWTYLQELNKSEGVTVFFTTHYMEEASRIAQRISIIDHGKIIATGTTEELQTQTQTASLEDAFLKLTGNVIRDESISSMEHMRQAGRMFRGVKR